MLGNIWHSDCVVGEIIGNFHLSNDGMILLLCALSIAIAAISSYMAARLKNDDEKKTQ